jgi:hypothetical protein
MSEQFRYGQQADGSLVFPMRIRGLPAMPLSPREVAYKMCCALEEWLWRNYSPLCSVNVAEELIGWSQRDLAHPAEE